MAHYTVGDFVWYDLLTSDPKAAIAFYSEVVGWKTQPFGDDYVMWVGSSGPLGGVMKLPEQAAKMGAPPHWTAHVQVANVDATIKQIKDLGGTIYQEPTDIPEIGRFAVFADPQGVTINAFTPLKPTDRHDSEKGGEFCWSELATPDLDAAVKFYGTIFGWKQRSDFDMGPMGKYRIYGTDRDLGGMMTKPKEMPVACWMYYTHVDDLDAAVARAKAKGAKLMNGPMEVPGGARIAQLMDPQGAAFALHGK